MTDLRKAAEQAAKELKGLIHWHGLRYSNNKLVPAHRQTPEIKSAIKTLKALRQALNVDAVNMSQERVDETVKREHEPVAWVIEDGEVDYYTDVVAKIKPGTPLYTAPPKREWVGLTKEEAKEISMANRPYVIDMIAALEAKLKEKNT